MKRLVFLAVALCLAATGPSFAEKLTLTNDDAYPPYSRADLPGQGFLNVLVSEIVTEAGYEPEIDLLPWSRALRVTETGDVDVLVSAYHTDERAKIYHYSEPFYSADTVFVARADADIDTYSDLSDLSGMKIGIVRDNAYPGGLLDADLDFEEVSDYSLNVPKLAGERVDLVVELMERFRFAADEQQQDWSQFKILKPALGAGVMHVVVSRQHPNGEEIIGRFNEALATLRGSGRYDEILAEAGYD